MSIDKIREKILSDAEKQAEDLTFNAKTEAEKILKEAEVDAEKIKTKMEKLTASSVANIKNRKISVANLEIRKMYLEVKQEAVNIAVRIAITEIAKMSKEEYLDFITKVVVEAGVSEGELRLNKKDKEAIGEALVKRVNQEMVDGKIVLSDETIKEQGGFILKRGKMEVNSTIETMVNAIKSDITPEVVATLF